MNIRDNVLPVLGPFGGEEEIIALSEVIRSGWWGNGKKVKEFEEQFSNMVGSKYAVAVTSNTHGLDLVFKALNIKNKDVISPTISFLTTAVVPLWNDCSSTIVDVDPVKLCIDPIDVKNNLKNNTEAIIAVNMAGVPAPITEIRSFYKGLIIEDCAHSCYTKNAGTYGDVAIWSFQAVKTMPSGDGGMITTNDKNLYTKLKKMTWFGIPSTYDRINISNYNWDYDVDILGYKCYMIDLTACICLEQMKKLEKHLEFRRHIQERYNKELNNKIIRPYFSDTVQYYCARIDGVYRNNLMTYLSDKKIHTSVHFKPLHKYEITKQNRIYPVADNEWLKLISLPCHNRMIENDIDYVIYWVNKYCEDYVK